MSDHWQDGPVNGLDQIWADRQRKRKRIRNGIYYTLTFLFIVGLAYCTRLINH